MDAAHENKQSLVLIRTFAHNGTADPESGIELQFVFRSYILLTSSEQLVDIEFTEIRILLQLKDGIR